MSSAASEICRSAIVASCVSRVSYRQNRDLRPHNAQFAAHFAARSVEGKLPMPGPLAGVRVLELARILAGPWAGQVLADLGADVIKVERSKTGDDTRAWGPPFIEGKDGHLGAAYFHSTNRGKRSIECDFESEDGKRIVRKLAARSDVLIENFKVGGLAKFGLDYAEPRAVLPTPDLLLGDRLRPDRAERRARRLRPDGAGHRRLHGADRRARRSARPGRNRSPSSRSAVGRTARGSGNRGRTWRARRP